MPKDGSSRNDLLDDIIKVTLPDEDDTLAFLVSFRKFILNKEPVQVNKILNLLAQGLSDGLTKCAARRCRAGCKESSKDGIHTRVGESVRSPEESLDLWINGYVFHTDADKLEDLNRMPSAMRDALKVSSLSFALNTTSSILALKKLINRALRLGLISNPPSIHGPQAQS